MNQAGLENVLGFVGASGYGENILPTARSLSKTTKERDPLLFDVNLRQVYPSGKTRLQAAAKSGDLATLQAFLNMYMNAPGRPTFRRAERRKKMIEMLLQGEDRQSSALGLLFESNVDISILEQILHYEPSIYNKEITIKRFFSWGPKVTHTVFVKIVDLYTSLLRRIESLTPNENSNNEEGDNIEEQRQQLRNKANRIKALILHGIQHSADVNSLDDEGYTILSLFTSRENFDADIINALLASPEIDVNKEGTGGNTPLFNAVLLGNVGLVHRLLEKGARDSINVVNRTLFSVIGQAAFQASFYEQRHKSRIENEGMRQRYEANLAILNDLIQHNFDPNFYAHWADRYATTLMLVVRGGGPDTIQRILSIPGIHVNGRDHNGENAFFYIVKGQRYNQTYPTENTPENREKVRVIVKMLLDAGVNINEQAASWPAETIVEYLTSLAQEDPNYQVLLDGFNLAIAAAPNAQAQNGQAGGGSRRKMKKTRKGKKARRSKGTKKRV